MYFYRTHWGSDTIYGICEMLRPHELVRNAFDISLGRAKYIWCVLDSVKKPFGIYFYK